LLAQPSLQTDVLKTIRYAVWQHGAAADFLSARRRAWTVEDLIQNLGTVGVA
jgi:NAD(P)H-hydrate repair Nnr-like enzyme with NAD(P)H-hydrate dehydratase domain